MSSLFSGQWKRTFGIIAFHIHDQELCVRTTTIREIGGPTPSTSLPHSPPDVIGVMNIRGSVSQNGRGAMLAMEDERRYGTVTWTQVPARD